MPQCSVPDCKSRTTRKELGVTFHRFPNDEDRRKQWANAMQRQTDWKVPKFAYVCSKHFRLQDFDLTSPNLIRLRTDAVPTVVVPGSAQQRHGEPSKLCISLPSHVANPGRIVLGGPLFVQRGTGISVLKKQAASSPISEKTILLPASCATLVARVSDAATSLMLKDRVGAMAADVVRSREGSCSQWTQANITTATIGTQCALRLSISVETQTGVEFSVGDNEACSSFERHPTLHDGAGNTVEAPVGQPDNPSCSGCPRSGNTRTWANNHKETQFRAGLHSWQPCQQNQKNTTCTTHEQVDARKMPCQEELAQGIVHTAGKKHYICRICQKVFLRKRELDKHVRLHTREKPDVCRVSQQSFTQSGQLPSHKRVHTGEEGNQRDVCQESLTKKVHLVENEALYTIEQPHICSICRKNFANKWSLVRHERLHTGEKPYVCDVCQKSFAQKAVLVGHMRVHTGERPYVCDVCHKSFTQKGVLVSHRRVHTGEKPYVCTVCQKSFTEKGHLVYHEKLHTGERPYTCSMCEKRFIDKHSLSRHEKLHTGKTPYKCGTCQKRFAQKGHLARHKRVHTGEKPYMCSVCGSGFAEKGHLVKHQKLHSGERPYVCSVCNKRFAIKQNLTKHEKSHR